jgi:hypothetical protein
MTDVCCKNCLWALKLQKNDVGFYCHQNSTCNYVSSSGFCSYFVEFTAADIGLHSEIRGAPISDDITGNLIKVISKNEYTVVTGLEAHIIRKKIASIKLREEP